MPLRGSRVHRIRPGTVNSSGFQIDYTGETFSSIDAYQKTLKDYEKKEWSCQCTGKNGLTYKQALESEAKAREMIAATFPQALYKPVLTCVHHNRENLDMLLARMYDLIQRQFFVGEEIEIRQKPGYVGKVTEKTSKPRESPVSKGDTPPSDKENKDEYSYTVQVSKRTSLSNGEQTEEGKKTVSNVPATALKRTQSVTKDLLRLFIRGHAVKEQMANSSMPTWCVNEDMVKTYAIKNKFAPLFLSASPSTSKNTPKSNSVKSSVKPVKIDSTQAKSTPVSAAKINGVKDDASTTTVSSSSSSDSSDNDDSPAPVRRAMGQAPSSVAARKQIKQTLTKANRPKPSPKQVKGQTSLNQFVKTASGSPLITLSDSDDDKKVGDFRVQVKKNMNSSMKKKKAMATLIRGPASIKKSFSVQQTPKKKTTPFMARTQSLTAKSDDSEDEKCLAVIAKSPSRTISPTKKHYVSQFELQQRRLKSTVAQGEGILSKFGPKHQRWFLFLGVTVQYLTMKQIESIQNEVIREALKQKLLKKQEKEMLKKMTEEEIKEYRKQKQIEARNKMKIVHAKKEDSTLKNLTCLPAAKIVGTPEMLANRYFGDVVMIVEFINTYQELLTDKKTRPITTEALMAAVCSGSGGFEVLGEVLILLLQTLMQDEVAKDYRELNTKLSKIPVDMSTSAELARLCLRRKDSDGIFHDDDAMSTGTGSEREDHFDQLDPALMERLGKLEFFELRPEEQLAVLSALVHRLLDSYCINEYQDNKAKEFKEAWKEHNRLQQEKKAAKPAANTQNIDKFCQQNGKTENGVANGDVEKPPESPKLSRRESLERDKKRRDEQERMTRQKRIEEEEKLKKELEDKAVADRFKAIDRLYKTSLRLKPLGTDRNHSRYWIFSNRTPGLFVEQGWAPECIDYNVAPQVNKDECIADVVNSVATGINQEELGAETTAPTYGVNQWYFYSNPDDIENLIKALTPLGIRESELKKKLQEMKSIVLDNVKVLNKQKEQEKVEETKPSDQEKIPESVDDETIKMEEVEAKEEKEEEEKTDEQDNYAEYLGVLKQELLDTETEVRDCGFGGVLDLHEWGARLHTADKLNLVGECMIESMQGIEKRFLKDLFDFKKSKKNTSSEIKEEDGRVSCSPEVKGVDLWIEAVRQCKTMSRMQVLHSILYLSVTWHKSAAKARCLACRRKGMDGQLLLCDDCFCAYHMYCLRPPLKKVPENDWFCPTCKPKHAPQKSRIAEKVEEESEEESERSDSEEEESEEEIILSRKPAKRKAVDVKEGRSAKKRAAEAIKEQESVTSSGRRGRNVKQEEEEEEEEEEIDEDVNDVFKQIMSTRTAHALHNLNLEDVPSTRSNRGRKKPKQMDLKMVKGRLSTYKNVHKLFDDLELVIDTARQHFDGQSRKLSQVDDLEEKVGELRSEYNQ